MIIAKIVVLKGKRDGMVQIFEPPLPGPVGVYDAKDITVNYDRNVLTFRTSLTVEEEGKEARIFETNVYTKYDLLEFDEEILRGFFK